MAKQKISLLREVFGSSFPIYLILALLFIPSEFSLFIGGIQLSFYRVFLCLLAPILMLHFIQGKRYKIRVFDVLFLLFSIWLLLAFMAVYGFLSGLESGGIYLVETLLPYLLARSYIRSPKEYFVFFSLALTLLAFVLLTTLPEAYFGRHFVHEIAEAITGNATPYDRYDVRLGFTRATGPFDHPIIYGAFAASLLPVVWFCKPLTKRLFLVPLVFLSVLLTASSGPILVLTTIIFLIAWRRIARGLKVKQYWHVLIALSLFGCLLLNVFVASPMSWLIEHILINPTTGWERSAQWSYGMIAVNNAPIFGIGNEVFARASWMSWSVDSLWLVFLTSAGYPAFLLLLAAVVKLVFDVAKTKPASINASWFKLRISWTLSFIGLSFAGIAVHFWGAMLVYYFILAGAGGAFLSKK